MNNIGIIGTGNMAGAILEGALNKGFLHAKNVYIYNRSIWRNDKYTDKYSDINISIDFENMVKNSKYIVVGVKPYAYSEVLNQIKPFLNNEHVVISIAAGVSIDDIESVIGSAAKVVRTMPNTPALVLEGMTAITYNVNVAEKEKKYISDLFDQVGKSEVIDEKLMDIIP
ncbi:MAG: NAD(P)-binding domain-containing protein, partial [Acidaminobacteraceae bacterium]